MAANGTSVSGLNDGGAVVGQAITSTNTWIGFFRTPLGGTSNFGVPGAGRGANQGVLPLGINRSGQIVGTFWDVNFVSHGFLKN
jgi:hypothetical protein